MGSSWLEKRPALAASGIGVLGAICLLVFLEALVRWLVPSISFRDTDARLILVRAFHGTHGNARGFTGQVFGVPTTTDSYGFRIDRTRSSLVETLGDRPTVLFLGDSVTFGVGVGDGKTFVDRVRANATRVHVMNASSIGYFLESYENVVRAFVVPNRQTLGIRKVVLGICLNDLTTIREPVFEGPRNAQDGDALHATDDRNRAKQYNTLAVWFDEAFPAANRYLRSRSKLFLLLKSLSVDSGRGHFLADTAAYRDAAAVDRSLGSLGRLAADLRRANIDLDVLLFAYEYQLRSDDPATHVPQRVLADFLAAQHVRHFDLIREFRRNMEAHGRRSADYYLFDDPMHLSELGHETVSRFILENAIAGP